MATTQEAPQTIKSTYLDAAKKYGVGNEALFNALGEELFTCPASTLTSLYNAFPGGLVDHMLRVAKYSVRINSLLPDHLKQDMKSIMKVALLCQIGKVGMYTPCTSDWHRKNQGKMYEYVEDRVSMRVGQKSLYYLSQACVKLTETEYQALICQDSNTSEDNMVKWHSEPLTVILRQAIELATIEEKAEKK
jgi:hypothetical protein